MIKPNKRVDEYIFNSPEFARPILERLRKVVYTYCPYAEEEIKWGMPSFMYKNQILCGMAAFKKHCVFGFWKNSLLNDPDNILDRRFSDGGEAMGNLGRITNLKELPTDKVIGGFIKQAMKLNDDGVKIPKKSKASAIVSDVPEYFLKELMLNKKAFDCFNSSSNSFKKEYIEWVTDAKTEATRQKRITTAIEWISEGKGRNWKYERK